MSILTFQWLGSYVSFLADILLFSQAGTPGSKIPFPPPHIHFIGKQTGPVHILFFLGVEKVSHLWLKGLSPTRMQVLPEECIKRIFVWKEGHVGTGCQRCGKGRMRLGGWGCSLGHENNVGRGLGQALPPQNQTWAYPAQSTSGLGVPEQRGCSWQAG